MYNFVIVEFEAGSTSYDLWTFRAWRAIAAEFIGTFLFVFAVVGSVVSGSLASNGIFSAQVVVQTAIAQGFTIALLVGAFGNISGGHMNPAVTFAFVISGRLSMLRGVMYVVAQLIGGIFGAGLFSEIAAGIAHGNLACTSLAPGVGAGQGFLLETVLTFTLVMTVFGTAVDENGPGHIAPLLIGFAVMVGECVGLPITGASMNPARSLASAVWGGTWRAHWIYWFGPGLGAFLAVIVYTQILNRGLRTLGPPLSEEIEAEKAADLEEGKSEAPGEEASEATPTLQGDTRVPSGEEVV